SARSVSRRTDTRSNVGMTIVASIALSFMQPTAGRMPRSSHLNRAPKHSCMHPQIVASPGTLCVCAPRVIRFKQQSQGIKCRQRAPVQGPVHLVACRVYAVPHASPPLALSPRPDRAQTFVMLHPKGGAHSNPPARPADPPAPLCVLTVH